MARFDNHNVDVVIIPDARKIRDIHPSCALNICGRVIEYFGQVDRDASPINLVHGRPMYAFTLLGHNSLVDVFLYDEFAEKCCHLTDGDHLTIRGPKTIVYNANPVRNIDNDKFGRDFIPYCIVIQSSNLNKPSSFRIDIKSDRIMNEKHIVSLTYDNSKTIDIPWRPIIDAHNIEGEVNVTPQKRSRVDDTSPAVIALTMDPYLTLQEAANRIDADVNIFAVMVSATGIKESRGRDKYCTTYCLLDRTQPNSQYPIILSLFSNHTENFPVIHNVGDILRIRRVHTQMYSGKLQLVGNVDHNKGDRGCSVLVFHRKLDPLTGIRMLALSASSSSSSSSSSAPVPSSSSSASPVRATINFGLSAEDWEVRESTSKRYSFHVNEVAIVEQLYHWSQEMLFSQPLKNDTTEGKFVPLNDMYQRRFYGSTTNAPMLGPRCDSLGMITNVSANADDTQATVTVWDGSTPGDLSIPTSTAPTITRPGAVPNNIPISSDVHRSLISAKLYALCVDYKNIDALCHQNLKQLPTHLPNPDLLRGCAVTFNCQGAHAKRSIAILKPGMWVRFRNLHVDYDVNVGVLLPENVSPATSNIPVATIYGDTHVCPLLPCYRDARDAATRIIPVNAEAAAVHPPRAPRPMMSAQGHPYTPLALCLTSEAPAKFCILARILSWWPNEADRFTKRVDDTDKYLFSLRIGDDTAECDVILTDDDAEYFLDTPVAAFEDLLERRQAIINRLIELMTGHHTMDFYLLSYYTKVPQLAPIVNDRKRNRSNRNDVPAQVPEEKIKRFRVFNTKLFPSS